MLRQKKKEVDARLESFFQTIGRETLSKGKPKRNGAKNPPRGGYSEIRLEENVKPIPGTFNLRMEKQSAKAHKPPLVKKE